jgi:O-antigen ligase
MLKKYPLKKNYDYYAYQLVFISICICLSISNFIPILPKQIFYVTAYCSFFLAIGFNFKNKQPNEFYSILLTLIFLSLGIVRLCWSYFFSDRIYSDIDLNYHNSGKVLICASVLAFFIFNHRRLINLITIKIGFVILFLGLLVTAYHAGYESLTTHSRVKLISDSAGTVSYTITFLAISISILANRIFSRKKLFFFLILVCLLNTYIMGLTQSRSGIISIPFIYIYIFATSFKMNKGCLIVLTLSIFTCTTLMAQHTLRDRLKNITHELGSYAVDNDTSIGARLSIWKAGFFSLKLNMLGQSAAQRTEKARFFIKNNERSNPEAYKNIKYHLHNDILETTSLQGFSGLVSLIFFYAILLLIPLKFFSYISAILPLSLVWYGLTDTVLIQQTSMLITCISVILSFSLIPSRT